MSVPDAMEGSLLRGIHPCKLDPGILLGRRDFVIEK